MGKEGLTSDLEHGVALEKAGERGFQALRPILTTLVSKREDIRATAAALEQMHEVIASLPPAAVRGCFDYVMFPLVSLVDAGAASRLAADIRQGDAKGGQAKAGRLAPPAGAALPAATSDRVFELALAEIAHTVGKMGRFTDPAAPVELLRRLCGSLALGRAAATEEARAATVECVQGIARAAVASERSMSDSLSGEDSAPLIGHTLSALLKTAQAELAAGHQGSRALSLACVESCGAVVAALGDPDAVAFFVPGLVTELSTILTAGTSGAPGAATAGGSATSSTAEAAAGGRTLAMAFSTLVSVLCTTLGDSTFKAPVLSAIRQRAAAHPLSQATDGSVSDTMTPGSASPSAADALKALRRMALNSSAAGTSKEAEAATSSLASSAAARPGPPVQQPGPGSPADRRLRIERTADWAVMTMGKASEFLRPIAARLLYHPSPRARAALASGAARLLTECGAVSAACGPDAARPLVEAMFALVHDEAEEARGLSRTLLSSLEVPDPSRPTEPHVALRRHVYSAALSAESDLASLPRIVRQMGAAAAVRHAQRAATALEVAGPAETERWALSDPGKTARILSSMYKCFEYSREEAALLLNTNIRRTYEAGQASSSGVGDALSAAAVLPRMPLGLKYISDSKLYAAVARLARLLGRAAVLTPGPGGSGSALSSIMSDILATYRKRAAPGMAARGSPVPSTGPTSTESWQLSAASVLTVLQEVLHGASAAWRGDFITGGGSDSASPQRGSAWELPTGGAAREAASEGQGGRGAAAVSTSSPEAAGPMDPDEEADLAILNRTFGVDPFTDGLGEGLDSDLRPSFGLELDDDQPGPALAGPSGFTKGFLNGSRSSGRATPAPPPPPSAPQAPNSGAGCASSGPGPAAARNITVDPTKSLVSAAESVHDELFGGRALRLWDLATSPEDDSDALSDRDPSSPSSSSSVARLTLQQLGENAAIMRALLECVGTAAAALGTRYSSSARLLGSSLLHVLSRMGDPAASVAACAAAAAEAMAAHGGFGTVRGLLRGNIDYLVEGVCRQLRDLDNHPRAPHLLAAILSRAGSGDSGVAVSDTASPSASGFAPAPAGPVYGIGAAADLLPLMAEAVRLTLSGISILARSRKPGYTVPFLRALRELARAAETEGAAVVLNSQARFSRHAKEVEAAVQAAAAAEAASEVGSTDRLEEPGGISGVRKYFAAARKKTTQEKLEELYTKGIDDDGPDGPIRTSPGYLPAPKAAALGRELEGSHRRCHGAAVVAAAVIDSAAPLISSPDLTTALLAFEASIVAIRGLQGAADAVSGDNWVRRERGVPEGGLRAPLQEVPPLFVSVHVIWPFLMAGLRDPRPPLVERAADALSDIVHVAGGEFVARRVCDEAWPVLQRILRGGRPLSLGAPLAPTTSRRGPAAAAPRASDLLLAEGDEAPGPSSTKRLTEHAAATAALRVLTDGLGQGGDGAGPGSSSPGSSEEIAPAIQLRVRAAVLRCLEAIAQDPPMLEASNAGRGSPEGRGSSGVHEAPSPKGPKGKGHVSGDSIRVHPAWRQALRRRPGSDAIRTIVHVLLESAVPFLGKGYPLPLQEQAVRTLQALSALDPDAAWLLLYDAAAADNAAAPPPPPNLPPWLASGINDRMTAIRSGAAGPSALGVSGGSGPGVGFQHGPSGWGPYAVPVPAAVSAASARAPILPVSALLPPFNPSGLRDSDYSQALLACRLGQCGPRASQILAAVERSGDGAGTARALWASKVIVPP